MTSPPLAPSDLALYASNLARTFGPAIAFQEPVDARARAAVRSSVVTILGEVRPHPDGPSLGEALSILREDARLLRPTAARNLAELSALFDQAAFRRTKRAERGRLFAELVVLFELEPAIGLERASCDAEEHLRRVRRRLRNKS